MKVLLVEDHPLNLDMGKRLLSKLGADVLCAKDGKEALDLYHSNGESIDAIVMDVNMPVMDGVDATYQIRDYEKKSGCKRIPIYLLSGDTYSGETIVPKEIDIDGFASKPFDVDELKAILNK